MVSMFLLLLWNNTKFLNKMKGNFFSNSIFAFTGEIISEMTTGCLSGVYGRLLVMKISALLGSTCFL